MMPILLDFSWIVRKVGVHLELVGVYFCSTMIGTIIEFSFEGALNQF